MEIGENVLRLMESLTLSVTFDHGVIILKRSNNSLISVETAAPQQAGGFIIKYDFGVSNITACR